MDDDDERKDDRAGEEPSDSDESGIGRWLRLVSRGFKSEIAFTLAIAGVGAALFGVNTLGYEEPVLQAVLCFLAAIGLWVLAFIFRPDED
jgi:hypothetical protein